MQTVCGDRTSLATQGNLPPGVPLCTDLAVESVDTGTNPANPFGYSGPYSLDIANVALEDAAGDALILYPTQVHGHRVKDVYIHGSAINNAAIAAILIGSNTATNYEDVKSCDSNPNFRDDLSVPLPRNIRIEGNSFANNNTSVIAGLMRWLGVRNNSFTNNYRNWQVLGNDIGGTIFVSQCGDTVEISGNTPFTGPAISGLTKGASGLELWGRNIAVQGNNISGYPSEGIGLHSARDVTITGNSTQHNSTATPLTEAELGGIQIQTRAPGGRCDPIPRDVDHVTINGNHSHFQPYGLLFVRDNDGRNTIKNVDLSLGNDFSGTKLAIGIQKMVTLSPDTNPAPTLVDEITPPTPRALPVDAVTPISHKCDTGSVRQTFRFPASELTGASNIQSIQAAFTIPFDANDEGLGGPRPPAGAPWCHFFYTRAGNTVYLDDPAAGYTWPYSSVVGAGGTSLSNGYCAIHAGSVSAPVLEPKVLSVTLDVQFLDSAYLSSKKYMYVVVKNEAGQVSAGDGQSGWRYWGWWQTP